MDIKPTTLKYADKRKIRKLSFLLTKEEVFIPESSKFGTMFYSLHKNGLWKCRICKVPVTRYEIVTHVESSNHVILLQKHEELYKGHYACRATEVEEPIQPPKYSLQEHLDSITTSPLIGTEYILEIEYPSPVRRFICILCSNMKCNPVHHLLSYSHKMQDCTELMRCWCPVQHYPRTVLKMMKPERDSSSDSHKDHRNRGYFHVLHTDLFSIQI